MRVAIVLKGYPRLSETFIAQEILALERRGLDTTLVSLRHPTDPSIHPAHREIRAPVLYLPEYVHREPQRSWNALRRARRLPGYAAARRLWLADLRRDPTRNRIRRFVQAGVLAAELPAGTTHLHAHFLHTPASVARYAAWMAGLPWSASAHAKDIWLTPEWELREKLGDASWTVTCTAFGAARLRKLASDPARVGLVYHGLDLARFPAPTTRRPATADPVTVLSVGRLVAKKGYADLLAALALLPDGLSWRFRHIGGGPLAGRLAADACALGIADRVEWLGPRPQQDVLAALRAADVFALASTIAADGDRDGLPNVLMEAQSQALPVVSTTAAAIPELVRDGETGLLVPPGDADALSKALAAAIADADLRHRLGAAGLARVRAHFSLDAGIDALAARFGLARRDAA